MSARRASASTSTLDRLLGDIRACRLCEAHLPLGPRPVLRASASARLLIVGQAPGTKVHASGVPWDDASGKRLRDWLDMTPDVFYDETRIAIVPMGFCYPGKQGSGDAPPRPECRATWHPRLLPLLPDIGLTLLIGKRPPTSHFQNCIIPASLHVTHARGRSCRNRRRCCCGRSGSRRGGVAG